MDTHYSLDTHYNTNTACHVICNMYVLLTLARLVCSISHWIQWILFTSVAYMYILPLSLTASQFTGVHLHNSHIFIEACSKNRVPWTCFLKWQESRGNKHKWLKPTEWRHYVMHVLYSIDHWISVKWTCVQQWACYEADYRLLYMNTGVYSLANYSHTIL